MNDPCPPARCCPCVIGRETLKMLGGTGRDGTVTDGWRAGWWSKAFGRSSDAVRRASGRSVVSCLVDVPACARCCPCLIGRETLKIRWGWGCVVLIVRWVGRVSCLMPLMEGSPRWKVDCLSERIKVFRKSVCLKKIRV